MGVLFLMALCLAYSASGAPATITLRKMPRIYPYKRLVAPAARQQQQRELRHPYPVMMQEPVWLPMNQDTSDPVTAYRVSKLLQAWRKKMQTKD